MSSRCGNGIFTSSSSKAAFTASMTSFWALSFRWMVGRSIQYRSRNTTSESSKDSRMTSGFGESATASQDSIVRLAIVAAVETSSS